MTRYTSQQQELFTLLMNGAPEDYWWDTKTLQDVSVFCDDDQAWGQLKTHARRQGISVWEWERKVREMQQQADADVIEATRFPFVAVTSLMPPPLPPHAACRSPDLHTWLTDYVAHSTYWAPRAAPGFHVAVGLWVLSTVAARRIVLRLGSTDLYPTLFLAMIAESTLWTKTTAAALGIRVLRRAGCGPLLGPDRTTPQYLLKIMAGIVPPGYGRATPEEQDDMRQVYGFSAQRGWFYEEWGGMLHQMRRTDSPQAELNKLLIVLEGGAPTFESGTIARGLEKINAPYLALLCNATPHDLLPFMGEEDAWWHDGFWPRFLCITPPDETPVRTPRPREVYHVPAALIMQLHDWHARLGFPQVRIEEIVEDSGKRTGQWKGTVSHFPEQVLTMESAVYDAYETYNDALLDLVQDGKVHSDLAPWYARAHEKALRVAMLLASVQGETMITLPYWQEAQTLMEDWRTDMHRLVGTIQRGEPGTPMSRRQRQLEQRIERLLSLSGGMTARELQRTIQTVTSEELRKSLESMAKNEILRSVKMGRKTLYLILEEEEGSESELS